MNLLNKGKFSASVLLLLCVTALLCSDGQATAQNSFRSMDVMLEVQDKIQTKHVESRILISASLLLLSQPKLTL